MHSIRLVGAPYNAGMRIAPAQSFDREAIRACLDGTARRDPLALPVPVDGVLAEEAWAAVLDGEVVGVAWSRPYGDGRVVEARVLPGFRRRGVGGALLARVEEQGLGAQALRCSCDAGHPRARRFIERRGFELEGVVFFQRWDGEPADVPPAFRTCRLAAPDDPGAALGVLAEGHRDVWPPPVVRMPEMTHSRTRARLAWVGEARAGVLVAQPQEDVWSVLGFAVLPEFRRRGVGRALLCDLMAHAAAEGRGVVLRVSHANPHQQGWTSSLGFWTYRSWACYHRPALPAREVALR